MAVACSSAQDAPEIVIIGSGVGGLGMAIQLKKAGIERFTVLEKNAGLGRIWRENSYPGAGCDVESQLYSFSFEPKADWLRKFARQPEILAYLEDCAEKYDLNAHIRFDTQVAQAAFDERRCCWTITTQEGDTIEAPILITACDRLNQPAYPMIPGIEAFAGTAFRSARWSALLKPFAFLARRQMDNEDKRQRLMPSYPIGCKRILISDDWYPAINRGDVDLVNESIVRVEADAVVTADGLRHSADVLIYGTAFKATQLLSPMRVLGRAGHDLNAAWQGGARAYKGITVNGFPNFFMLYGPNTNLAHNFIIFMLESQIRYVLQAVQALSRADIASLDVRRDREVDFDGDVQRALARAVWQAGCTSWYRNAAERDTVNWLGFAFRFQRATATLDPGRLSHRESAGRALGENVTV